MFKSFFFYFYFLRFFFFLRRSNLDEEGFKFLDIFKRWQRFIRLGCSFFFNSLDSDVDKRLSFLFFYVEVSSIRIKSSSFQNLCSKFDDSEVVVKKGFLVLFKLNCRFLNEVREFNFYNFFEILLNIENKFSYGLVRDKGVFLRSMFEDYVM